MDKELIDKVWKYSLPKEFKEEVKRHFFKKNAQSPFSIECDVLCKYFGHHNLISDAEGEEMLTVEADLVKELYQRAKEIEEESKRIHSPLVASKYRGVQRAIEDLFGSKCLPDEEKSVEFLKPKANSDFTPIPVKSFASKWDKAEPQPAEPKFKVGDMVKYRIDGKRYEVMGKTGKYHYSLNGYDKDVLESDLEPYTEPNKEDSECLHAESVKELRIASEESNLSNSSQDCDERFDTIIKRGFRADRRCNIAVQMIKAMMGCPEIIDRISSAEADSLLDDILHDALYLTDNLIAECRKGGSL